MGAVRSRATSPLGALLLAWGIIVVVAAIRKHDGAKGILGPAAGAIIVILIVALVGEITPSIATGFAGVLLLSALLGGGANVITYLGNLPKKLGG